MTPEQNERVEAIFDAAVRLPVERRSVYLEEHCPDAEARRLVEAMVAADADGALSLGGIAPLGGVAADDPMPEQIGRYRIVGYLGRGGMGVVYEAEQDTPRRRVALKVMRPGFFPAAAARRFEVEAHVLGQLHHPGIAQIYESGVADDGGGARPYFAMELIDGLTLKAYTVSRDSSIRARLGLLMRIAGAVHHAHQKGVIHRDLKPDNILVDEHGQPKVLDFGVARAIDSDVRMSTMQTDAGQIIGTLAYMSPEQVLGRPELIDTRSDVYALGVIGYELLTGELPLDVTRESVPSALRMIQETTPRRVGHSNARLRGDIETIISKAMEKEPARRYQSAAELGDDIRRFLDHEPIVARPASTIYLLRKFARRNTVLVAGVGAVLTVLIAATIVSSVLYLRAERNLTRALGAERDASREGAVAAEVSGFLASMFEQANPWEAGGRTITAREIVDRGAARIERELAPDSPVRARLMHVLGNVYYNLGRYDESRRLAEESFGFHRGTLDPWHPLVMQGRRYLARLELRAGTPENLDKARALLNESLGYFVSGEAGDPEEQGEVLHLLAAVALTDGDYAQAMDWCEASLATLASIRDASLRRERLAGAHHMLGVANYYLRRYDEAERSYRTALDAFRSIHGREHPAVATAHSALGLTLQRLGRLEEAEMTLREGVAIGEAVWGAGSINTTPAMNNLALTLESLGRLDDAEAIFRRLIETYTREFGDRHHVTLQARNNLATVLTDKGEFAGAEQLFTTTRAMQIEALGAGHPETLSGGDQLARLYERMSRWNDAERLNREQHARFAARYGQGDARTLAALASVAENVRSQGRVEEAIALRRREVALRGEHFGAADQGALDAVAALAGLLVESGRAVEAGAVIDTHRARLLEAGETGEAAELRERFEGSAKIDSE